MAYRILLEKENFKFSCAHFTVFGPNHAERLHGHNYSVIVDLRLSGVDPQLGMAFDFNLVKPIIRDLVSSLDEHVLLPAHSPHARIDAVAGQVRVQLGIKHYSFPSEDVKILPIVNVTSEELAAHITRTLVQKLEAEPAALGFLEAIAIGVQETRGQTAFFEHTFERSQALSSNRSEGDR